MAKIISNAYINFYEHGVDNWITDWSSERIDIGFAGGSSVFLGSGFAFDYASELWSGTATYYAEFDNSGNVTFEMSEFAQPAPLFQYDWNTIFNEVLAGPDVIGLLGTSNDVVFAGGGDDIIYSYRGSKYIDGGTGVDTVVYEMPVSNYDRTRDNEALYVRGEGSNDTLVSVERVAFADGLIAFDQNAAQMYRLYQAAFDRTPDTEGLSYWVVQADAGVSLAQAAHGFMASNEFRDIYGANPTDSDIINLLYLNVLDRQADQAGFDYWGGQLTAGLSRADLLVQFSESGENIANTAPAIEGGIWLV